jgi:YidC/Oxa1 family membrane protein insertase
MEKRVIIAVLLCVGVMLGWTKIFPPTPPAPAPIASSTTPGGSPGAASLATVPGAVAMPTASHPEQLIELKTADERFVFSTVGGSVRHAQLLDPRFVDIEKSGARTGHDLIRTFDATDAALLTTFPGATFPALDGSWQVAQQTPSSVTFFVENAAVRIEKRYVVDTTRYRLHLDLVVQNKTDKSQDHHLAVHLFGRQDPEKKGGGFLSGGSANLSSMLCDINDKVERISIEKLAKDPLDKIGGVRWLGTDEKFFLFAVVPYPETPPLDRACKATSNGEIGQGVLSFAERTVPARGAMSYAFAIYAGPKDRGDLKEVRPGGLDANLDESVDVTLAPISRPILALLKFFHGISHNWGVAIILLTVFIKLLTFYPTQKSLLSAKKMQKLTPKMNAIRKKYENDKQRQSVETMNLYKAHGVSPFGGCLPSLIQMPIWIALYSTLNYAVELYRAPFILHIHDLTAKDPFYITPLLMGGVMYLQMKMSPASPDNQQQAMMAVMMPVMFTAFSLVLPSGLALYMLTSYLIGILQQLYINRIDRKTSPAV